MAATLAGRRSGHRPPSQLSSAFLAGASSTLSSSSCPSLMPPCDFHSKLTSSTNKLVSTMLLSQTHLTPKSAGKKQKKKRKENQRIKKKQNKRKWTYPMNPSVDRKKKKKKRHPSSLLSPCTAEHSLRPLWKRMWTIQLGSRLWLVSDYRSLYGVILL